MIILILLLAMLMATLFFLVLLHAGKVEENLLEERMRNRSDFRNNKLD